jgi:hypothetical protein
MYISRLICITVRAELFEEHQDDFRRVLYNMRIKKFDQNVTFKDWLRSRYSCFQWKVYQCTHVSFNAYTPVDTPVGLHITTREAMNRFSWNMVFGGFTKSYGVIPFRLTCGNKNTLTLCTEMHLESNFRVSRYMFIGEKNVW